MLLCCLTPLTDFQPLTKDRNEQFVSVFFYVERGCAPCFMARGSSGNLAFCTNASQTTNRLILVMSLFLSGDDGSENITEIRHFCSHTKFICQKSRKRLTRFALCGTIMATDGKHWHQLASLKGCRGPKKKICLLSCRAKEPQNRSCENGQAIISVLIGCPISHCR